MQFHIIDVRKCTYKCLYTEMTEACVKQITNSYVQMHMMLHSNIVLYNRGREWGKRRKKYCVYRCIVWGMGQNFLRLWDLGESFCVSYCWCSLCSLCSRTLVNSLNRCEALWTLVNLQTIEICYLKFRSGLSGGGQLKRSRQSLLRKKVSPVHGRTLDLQKLEPFLSLWLRKIAKTSKTADPHTSSQ